jgi:hypothetical protein
MIQLAPQMRLLVAIAPADFRRGIDGLVRVCRESLGADPFSGTVFVFRNRRAQWGHASFLACSFDEGRSEIRSTRPGAKIEGKLRCAVQQQGSLH